MEETQDNFILDYIRYNEGTEIPNMFALWCGIAGVAIAVGRRVYINIGVDTLFPNFYIVLVAGSGQKKSTAINQLMPIIRALEPPPKIVAQKMTPESLIKALRETEVVNGGTVLFTEKCEGWAIVGELSNFLNRNVYDAGMGSLLTEFFDCKDYWDYQTLSRGKEKLNNLYLGILGASTIDWLSGCIPEAAIGGGLTSRIIFVLSQEQMKPVAIPEMTDEKRMIHERMIRTLRKISGLVGEIKLTDGARALYKEIYDKFYYENSMKYDKMMSGYSIRRNHHILKLAGILAISYTNQLLIRDKDITAAQRIIEAAEQNLPLVMALITTSSSGQAITKVFDIIRRFTQRNDNSEIVGGISKSLLLSYVLHQMGVRDLGEVLDSLITARKIDCQSNGKDVIYFAL